MIKTAEYLRLQGLTKCLPNLDTFNTEIKNENDFAYVNNKNRTIEDTTNFLYFQNLWGTEKMNNISSNMIYLYMLNQDLKLGIVKFDKNLYDKVVSSSFYKEIIKSINLNLSVAQKNYQKIKGNTFQYSKAFIDLIFEEKDSSKRASMVACLDMESYYWVWRDYVKDYTARRGVKDNTEFLALMPPQTVKQILYEVFIQIEIRMKNIYQGISKLILQIFGRNLEGPQSTKNRMVV